MQQVAPRSFIPPNTFCVDKLSSGPGEGTLYLPAYGVSLNGAEHSRSLAGSSSEGSHRSPSESSLSSARDHSMLPIIPATCSISSRMPRISHDVVDLPRVPDTATMSKSREGASKNETAKRAATSSTAGTHTTAISSGMICRRSGNACSSLGSRSAAAPDCIASYTDCSASSESGQSSEGMQQKRSPSRTSVGSACIPYTTTSSCSVCSLVASS
mmetsp:Transcript_2520/g.4257  ORF Transcript_2520/g.4257 Transcript_2520/m.4257 type:complete len:214 (-) Transcript_2520:635-1276(-)